jgi:hypothetical protein
MEALHKAYYVPPASYIFDAVQVVEEARNEQPAELSCKQMEEGVRNKKLALARRGSRMVR